MKKSNSLPKKNNSKPLPNNLGKFYTNVFQSGDKIYYIGYENGQRVQYKEHFCPVLYAITPHESEYKTLDGKDLQKFKFGGIKDAKEFITQHQGVENFKIYGNEKFLYQYLDQNFKGDVPFDRSLLKIYTLDIETTAENGFPSVAETSEEILCLTIKDFSTKKFIVWGTREYEHDRDDVEYRVFWKETEMLQDFLNWWVENTPDILTGWNVDLFDVPYIYRRVERVLSEKYSKSLSPWNRVYEKEIENMGRIYTKYDIIGVSVLDYLDLYKKFTYKNQPTYRLDYIAEVELGEKKLDHSEFATFREFYTKDWQKFVTYNIHDVELVDRLEDKMKLIDLALTLAYDAKVNYTDVYYQVRMWDQIIYTELSKRNIVIPPNERVNYDTTFPGAFVKDPTPGLYEWVVNFDLNSLYPHLIMQYNISPETLLPSRHPSATVERILSEEIEIDGDNCVCPNGAQYRKDFRGFLPEIMDRMYDDRKVYKKRMLAAEAEYEKTPTLELEKEITKWNNFQMARKIQLNSAYGALGTKYFRYFNLANAEAITLSGQVSIRWIENKVNGYLNNLLHTEDVDYVIAVDTDSIYLNLGPLVHKFLGPKSSDKKSITKILDKVSKEKLEPFIDDSYKELAAYLSAYEHKMVMKRENIADKGIWTAKKRYLLNVRANESTILSSPKLKIMGLEAIRSSTPNISRIKLKEAYNIIMEGTENQIIEFIEKFRNEYDKLPLEDIAYPRSVNGLTKWKDSVTLYKKSCPIQVRASILYNHNIKKNKLQHKYTYIQNGDKIKYIYLKTPNKIGENVFAFISDFPEEIDISQYIDYKLQFTKSFLDPLKGILDVIGWKAEETATLDFLFV